MILLLGDSVCERVIALPGGAPPIYLTTAKVDTEAGTVSPSSVLCSPRSQSLSWQNWQEMSHAMDRPLLQQIGKDIPFYEEMGVGLWYFGRLPFLERLLRSANTLKSSRDFTESVVQSLLLGRMLTLQPTLPGYQGALATQLSVRQPRFSSLQWRAWLDFALALSFPLAQPTAALWNRVADYRVPIPGSPDLLDMSLKELLSKAAKFEVLPLAAGGIVSAATLLQGDYVAAWILGSSGAGISIVLAGTRSLLAQLAARTSPVLLPPEETRARRSSQRRQRR